MSIYVTKNEQKFGPYTAAEVRARIASGQFVESDPGWRDGVADRLPLSQLLALPPAGPDGATPIPQKSSGLARTSFIIAILGIGGWLLVLLAAAVAVSAGVSDTSELMVITGLFALAGMAANLTGVIFGIVALTKTISNRWMALTGVIANGVVLLGVLFLMILGSSPDPKTNTRLPLDAEVEAVRKLHPKWSAEAYVAEGDTLKGTGALSEASTHYLAALTVHPGHQYARYQLACTFSLAGNEQLALSTLRQAVEDGFWGYEMMRNDTDLEAVRQHAEFKHLLEQVSRRFAIEAPKRGLSPSIHVTEGVAPSNGWPILLFLHGYGDNGESYGPLADAATQCGFAGITISGPVVLWDQEYSWPTENFAATHSYLRRVLTHYSESKDLDRSRIYLCGFSQGATHAVGLVASYPREYAGAIALSPGGRPQLPQDVQTANPARPLYVTVGQMEHPANKELAKQSAELWRRASWPLLQHLHPGNHEFPDDWSDRFPRVLTWISNPTNGQ